MNIGLVFLDIAGIGRCDDWPIFPSSMNNKFGVIVGNVWFADAVIENLLQCFSLFRWVRDLGFSIANITIMPIGALSDFAHDFEFDLFCTLWILRYRDRCNRFLSSHLFFFVPGGSVIVLFILDSPRLVLGASA